MPTSTKMQLGQHCGERKIYHYWRTNGENWHSTHLPQGRNFQHTKQSNPANLARNTQCWVELIDIGNLANEFLQ